jgi:hypothetical protein
VVNLITNVIRQNPQSQRNIQKNVRGYELKTNWLDKLNFSRRKYVYRKISVFTRLLWVGKKIKKPGTMK